MSERCVRWLAAGWDEELDAEILVEVGLVFVLDEKLNLFARQLPERVPIDTWLDAVEPTVESATRELESANDLLVAAVTGVDEPTRALARRAFHEQLRRIRHALELSWLKLEEVAGPLDLTRPK